MSPNDIKNNPNATPGGRKPEATGATFYKGQSLSLSSGEGLFKNHMDLSLNSTDADFEEV